jgi:hypothetical protein
MLHRTLVLYLHLLCTLCAFVWIAFGVYAVKSGVYWFAGVCGGLLALTGIADRMLRRPPGED